MKIKNIILSFVMLSFILGSCEKDFLETAPTDRLSSDVLFDSYDGAWIAMDGVYRMFYIYDNSYDDDNMLGHHGTGYLGNVLDITLMGEDMPMAGRGFGWYDGQYGWRAHRVATGNVLTGRWYFFYNFINQNNNIINNIAQVEDATQSELDHIKAQALTMRALGYYWLALKHAKPYHEGRDNPGVPIYTEPQQTGNPRATVGEVYDRIVDDLDEAIDLFEASNMPREHESHATIDVAHGLAARNALAMNEYETAVEHAQYVIDNSGASLFTIDDFAEEPHMLLNDRSESEMLWAVHITSEQSPGFAAYHDHLDSRFMTYAQLGAQKLINAELYEGMADTDARKNWWVDPEEAVEDHPHFIAYNNQKLMLPNIGDYTTDAPLMRLSEMYLAKAEGLARGTGSDDDAAQALYDYMSSRDPDYEISDNTGHDLIEEIMFHRRIELWGEGFRFFDLKRSGEDLVRTVDQGHQPGIADRMHEPAGSDSWQWLIPQDEIDANDQISSGDQNP